MQSDIASGMEPEDAARKQRIQAEPAPMTDEEKAAIEAEEAGGE